MGRTKQCLCRLKNHPFHTASVANAAPQDGTLTYKWDFQDGTKGTGATATHRYAVAGLWRATVSVQGDGNDSGGGSGRNALYALANLGIDCDIDEGVRLHRHGVVAPIM